MGSPEVTAGPRSQKHTGGHWERPPTPLPTSLTPPPFPTDAPRAPVINGTLWVVAGDAVTVTCGADSEPAPILTVLRGRRVMAAAVYEATVSMELAAARPEDAGEYLCVAENQHGASSTAFNLSVECEWGRGAWVVGWGRSVGLGALGEEWGSNVRVGVIQRVWGSLGEEGESPNGGWGHSVGVGGIQWGLGAFSGVGGVQWGLGAFSGGWGHPVGFGVTQRVWGSSNVFWGHPMAFGITDVERGSSVGFWGAASPFRASRCPS